MKKKRRILWAVDEVEKVHKDRALLLNEKGFDVQFFTSVEQLSNELTTKRAAIIVISDGGSKEFASKAVYALMGMPHIQGARMVLTYEDHSPEIKFGASVASFRDIIPMDLTDKQFLQRFIFATATKPLPFIQPAGQVTLNNISAVNMPARITWISKSRLRVECRVKPPIGAILSLKGDLAEAMGTSSISLTVVENQRSHLIYRFSEAMICEWSVPKVSKDSALALVSGLKKYSPNLRCRVFLGAKSNSLRNDLLAQFDDPRFEVSAALQQHSLVNEPKFFTPHVVVVESDLISIDGSKRFKEMMKNVKEDAAIIIIGDTINIEEIRSAYPGRKIIKSSKMPTNLARAVLEKYAPVRQEHNADKDSIYLTQDNEYSMAEVSFSARLTRIHPVAVQVSLPFPIGQFALCRIESPILRKTLGRNPYLKFTAAYQDFKPDGGPFKYLADGYLADLNTSDRQKIGQTLTNIVYEQMLRFDVSGHKFSTNRGDVTRTPELGSVKLKEKSDLTQQSEKNNPIANPYHQVDNFRTSSSLSQPAAVAQNRAIATSTSAYSSKSAAITTSPIKREPISMDEIIPRGVKSDLKPGKLVREDFSDLLRPAMGPMAETVEDLTKGIKDTANNPNFLLAVKYVAIVTFLTLIFWGSFSLISKSYQSSGKEYSNSIRKFAPNHFKRFKEKKDP